MRIRGVIVFVLLAQALNAQYSQPENGPLFMQDEVARIDIILPEDSLVEIYEDIDYASEHEYEATFVYTSSEFSDTLSEIGFRLRGNTSLQAEKKSFKVSFNTFDNNGQYHGVEKLNLNGEHNDVSMMRSKLCWDALRERGLSASRTSYVALYINDSYFGLYLNVEHIDEEFVRKRFSNKIGNLYKCLYPSDLNYLGADPDEYKYELWGRRVYDLKTNRDKDDYRGLADFIHVLNNTTEEDFDCEIEKVFNVDDYLKRAAFDVLVGNWDGYIFGKNNYYLYEDPKTRRMEYLHYDLDNTLGIDFWDINWTVRLIYNYGTGERPLYDRLMESERYRAQFSFYIEEWMQDLLSQETIDARIEQWQALIAPYIATDDFYTLDYGFSYDDFLASGDAAFGEHVEFGISQYIEARYVSVLSQLELSEEPQVIRAIQDSILSLDTRLIRTWVEGEMDAVEIEIAEGDVISTESMFDDGAHMDGEAGDGEYGYILENYDDFIDYQILSTRNGEFIHEPCNGYNRVWFSAADGPIYLNELMASNGTTISDEAGEFDDWAELYNGGSLQVDLGDMYVTDDIHCPDKWRLPDAPLSNLGFELLWADNDEEQGPYHMNFKLSADGEELALFETQEGALRLMDHIIYGPQLTDRSWGRATDAGLPWVDFSISTPDASNAGGVISVEEEAIGAISIWPNPSKGVFKYQGPRLTAIQLFDLQGQLVFSEKGANSYDFQFLEDGVYLLRMLLESGAEVSSPILIQKN